MKEKILLIFCILLGFIFLSCSNLIKDNTVSVRINMMSQSSKEIVFRVYVENDVGCIVNGAVVQAENSSGIVELLEFENGSQCYKGTMNGCENDDYTIRVKSNLLKDVYEIVVPHTRLTKKPVITTFVDSEGNSMLGGKVLKKENEIQLAWTPIEKDVVYQVIVTNGLSTKWLASVKSCNVVIPANSLDTGSYYINVNAQKKYGDICYKEKPFYSVSNISSSSVSFCIE